MDLLADTDERQLVELTAAFVCAAFPASRLHSADQGRPSRATFSTFGEQGWMAMAMPEAAGGIGFSVVDECLVFQQGGRELVPPGVLFANLAAKLAAAAGEQVLVEQLATGAISVSLAVVDPQHGGLRLFEYAGADHALLIAQGAASLLSLTDARLDPIDCLDKSVTMARSTGRLAPLVSVKGTRPAHELTLLVAAMLVGIAEAVTDMIVAYAKVRETFGRPIGAYQAVRHPCADMAVRSFGARAQLYFAAVALRDGRVDAGLHVDAAFALAREAALLNVEANTQLHGGISTTDEHDAHLFLKRARLLSQLCGIRTTLSRVLACATAS